MKKQTTRAILIAIFVFFTGLAVYTGVPTSLDALWQPAVQAVLAGLGAMGINYGTRGKA